MKFTSPSSGAVRLHDSVLAPRQATNHAATIPASLRFCEETHRIDALRLKWKPGMDWTPHVFWDSDVAKVMEGMARDLVINNDPALAARLEELVDIVVAAQQPDGYLNSHFTLVEPDKRWTNLRTAHELYCAGHLIEAAVAHFEATGSRKFLDAVQRLAAHIDNTFGRGRGKKRGYPGHEELELALCRLAMVTGEKQWLSLAKYFVDERGRSPNYFDEVERAPHQDHFSPEYFQADKPVREQNDAHGHAVRWAYLACGMTDVADATGDTELLDAVLSQEANATQRRMLVTGGIGTSPWGGEEFEGDWQLRNRDAYAESCAAIGLVLLESRLHGATGSERHVDILEKALYNGVLSGISLSGDRFFYQNPLIADAASHFRTERQAWFSCSCCPTNFCRFLPQIGQLCWALGSNATEARLLIPAASELTIPELGLNLSVNSGYPYDGDITVRVKSAPAAFALSLRIPGWCRKWSLSVNGKGAHATARGGFVTLRRAWKRGDEIRLLLDMPVRVLRAHSAVADDAGLICLARGPLVYALESVDNGPGLHRLSINPDQAFKLVSARGLPRGTIAVRGQAVDMQRPGAELYSEAATKHRARNFTAIPYALWQNRGPAEMRVWVRESPV